MKSKPLFIVIFAVGIILTLGVNALYTGVIAPMFAPPPTLDEKYTKAIEDAMIAHSTEVTTGLTPITIDNPDLIWQGEGENATVLVVTWTKFPNSYPVNSTLNTSWGETWVTVAPEMQTFFKNNVGSDMNLTVRAAQLLGLPHNTSNAYFVEMWVSPQDLFRPSPDNEITDTTADLNFPSNVTQDYKAWFNGNIIHSYYPMKLPWTRLGYTYDWGADNHFGLSEYILKQNATITVKSVTLTEDYFRP